MKKLFRNHPESILVFLAIVFLAIIIACFTWGVEDVIEQVNRGVNVKPQAAVAPGFDLKAAQALDLRGLVNQ